MDLRTDKIEAKMLHTQPKLLLDVPANELSYEMCQIAVYADPFLLISVPNTFLEKNNCHIAKIAAGIDGMSISCIEQRYLNQELCDIASKNLKKANRDEHSCFLEHIPYSFITESICVRAVKHDKNNIDHVPLAFLNDKVGRIIMNSKDNTFLAKLPLLIRKNLSQR